MKYKPFYDLSISTLGMGSLRFPLEDGSRTRIDRAKARPVLDCALANGINYIDTAYTYNQGDAEAFLGEALSSYPRDSYLLSTKFYVAASRDIKAVFETQLQRCRTDYFDFYLLHCLDETTIGPYMDKNSGYLDYLLEQKRMGRIRHLGFSSHAQPETLRRFLDWYDDFDMAMIQLNYLDWDLLDARQQYHILEERNIPVWVMEPLKGGRLATLSPEAAGVLRQMHPDKSIASWGLRFLMGLPGVQTVLGGMSTVAEVEENVRIFSELEPLNAEEQAALKQAAAIFMEQLGVPCSACRYCCATCPAHLDIPEIIRCYNEYLVSRETWKISGHPALENGPSQCMHCNICLDHCPQKIAIPDIMKQCQQMLTCS